MGKPHLIKPQPFVVTVVKNYICRISLIVDMEAAGNISPTHIYESTSRFYDKIVDHLDFGNLQKTLQKCIIAPTSPFTALYLLYQFCSGSTMRLCPTRSQKVIRADEIKIQKSQILQSIWTGPGVKEDKRSTN